MSARVGAVMAGGGRLAGIFGRAKRFWRDRRGVAAIEFAMVVPLLFGMYYMTLEVGQAIDTNKKLSRAASMVGDIVTQQSDVTADDLVAVMRIAKALIQPYGRSGPTITVTGLKMTANAAATPQVVWSRQLKVVDPKDPLKDVVGTGRGKGSSVTTIPSTLRTPGKFMVMVEVSLTYKAFIDNWSTPDKKSFGVMSAFSSLSMGDNSYQMPRVIDEIGCTGC